MAGFLCLLFGIVSLFQVVLLQTQIIVLRDLVYAAEGGNVTISVSNRTEMYMMSWISPQNERIITFISNQVMIKPQTNYSTRISFIPTNGSLIITSVLKYDEGTYTISMEPASSMGQVTQIVKLIVYAITVTAMQPNVFEGGFITISCTASQNITLQKIWKKDGIALASNSHISITDTSVMITSASRDDAGNYSCLVQNIDGQGMGKAMVNVYYGPDSPVILRSQTKDCVSGDVLSGTPVSMSCSSASNPPANISWLLNQKYFTSNQSFSILSASSNDTGTYTCVANNSYAAKNSDTSLNVVSYCLSGGAVAGIVIGCVAFLLLLILLIVLLVKYRRKKKQESSSKSTLNQYPRATLENTTYSREQSSVPPASPRVPWYTSSSGGGKKITTPKTPEAAADAEWIGSLYKALTDKDGKFSTAV